MGFFFVLEPALGADLNLKGREDSSATSRASLSAFFRALGGGVRGVKMKLSGAGVVRRNGEEHRYSERKEEAEAGNDQMKKKKNGLDQYRRLCFQS